MYTGVHVSTQYFCQILMKLEFSLKIFEECSNIKLHENPSIWSRVVAREQRDRWADMTMLTVAFRRFSNAPKNGIEIKISACTHRTVIKNPYK
jgi:hypothetical protein